MDNGEVIPRNDLHLLPKLSQNPKSKDLAKTPVVEQAEALTRAWWVTQDPRPIQKFVVIRQVVQRALEAGWPPALLLEAMDNVPTISARWLEGYANRHKKATLPDKLAAVKRMLEVDEVE